MADRKLSITITGDASKAKKALGELDAAVGGSEVRAKKAGIGIGDALAGVAIGAWVKQGVDALGEVDRLNKQTAATIKSTGEAAGVTASEVNELATAIEKNTGIEAESIQSGQNMLLTFKNIKNEAGAGNDVFDQATQTLADMSTAMGTDASTSAVQLGKALNDPIKGIAALSKVGVTFDEDQKAMIRSMVEAGDVMGAQKIILAELNSEFGGSAEAFGESLPGQIAKAKNALGDVQEAVLAGAVPAIESGSKAVVGFAEAFGYLPDELQSVAVLSAAGGAAWIRYGDDVMESVGSVKEWVSGMTAAKAAQAAVNIGAGVAVAGGLFAVTEALAAGAELAARYEGAISDLRDAMVAGASPAEALGDHLAQMWTEKGEKLIGMGIGSVTELRNLVTMSDADFQTWADSLTSAQRGPLGLEAVVGGLRDQMDQATAGAERNTKATTDLADADTALAGEHRTLNQTLTDGMGPLERSAAGLRDQAAAAEETERAVTDLTTAAIGAFDSQTAYERSLASTTDAQRALAEAKTPDERAAAELRLRDAITGQTDARLALSQAEAIARGETIDSTDAATIQRIELELARQATGYWSDDLGTLAGRLDAAAKHREVSLSTTAAQQAINNLLVGLALFETKASVTMGVGSIGNSFRSAFGIDGARASGGPVWPGTWLVGEEGPELLHMGQAGSVSSASKTKQMLGGMSSKALAPRSFAMGAGGAGAARITPPSQMAGPAVVVQVQGSVVTERELADVVVDAIQRKGKMSGGAVNLLVGGR